MESHLLVIVVIPAHEAPPEDRDREEESFDPAGYSRFTAFHIVIELMGEEFFTVRLLLLPVRWSPDTG